MKKTTLLLFFASAATTVNAGVSVWTSLTTSSTTLGAPIIQDIYTDQTKTTVQGTYTFNNKVTTVTGFDAGGQSYTVVPGESGFTYHSATFRATPLGSAGEARVYYEHEVGDATTLTGSPINNLAEMFDTPMRINFGSDELFRNYVESITLMNPFGGITPTTTNILDKSGITFMERSGSDNLDVRLVTGIDGNGDPTSFTNSVRVNFGGAVAGSLNNFVVFDSSDGTPADGDGPFDIFHAGTRDQDIGGLIVTFDTFGIQANDTVYGYEITSSSGADLLPGSAVFIDTNEDVSELIIPVPEPSAYGLLAGIIAISACTNRSRSRSQISKG